MSGKLLGILDPARVKARFAQRSYWVAKYSDGKTISEWDGPDWSLIPRKGLQAVRLYCPNGQIAQLGNTIDASERIFQLKSGMLVAGNGRSVFAHIIGIITGTDGQSQCMAWDYQRRELLTFEDDVFDMRYLGIGRLSPDVLGIKPE